MYTKTLTAKRDYHLLMTNLPMQHIETQHHANACTALCLERRQCYEQAKHFTMQQYADAKTSFLTHERYARLHCSSQTTDDRPITPFFNRDVSSNWTTTLQQRTDKRQPSTGRHPDRHDRPYTSP